MAHHTKHVVYALVEREFLGKYPLVVKVGRTSQSFCRRIAQYPNGSHLIFSIHVRDAQACVDAEAELLMYMRGGSDSRIQPRRDVGAEYFEVGQATVYNGMFASASKYAWYGEDCGGKQEECDTPRDESVASAVESKETDQERMDRETYVSRVVTVIFDNVVQANIECYDTVHAFVEANATELSGAVLDQGAFVARVLSNLSASLRCSFTSKKVLSSLKDLGIQPIHYIFDGLLLPRRALRFPDFTRHKNILRFLDERCISTTPGDMRPHISTTPGMYNAYVTFCEEEGLHATVADVVELAQVVKECGLDTMYTLQKATPEDILQIESQFLLHLMQEQSVSHPRIDDSVSFPAATLFSMFNDWLSPIPGSPKHETTLIKFGLKMSKLGLRGVSKRRCNTGAVYSFCITDVINDMREKMCPVMGVPASRPILTGCETLYGEDL